jgi:UDP-N-acetylmuramate--alanine ligase
LVFLGRTKRIHFVGVGGIGMSGIAEVLLNLGFNVSGSDLRRSETTDRLVALGATVAFEHDAENVEGADVVVYSSAVDHTNPEVAAADRLGIPAIPRTEMLAELMRLKFAVTVAGSHGKTSTTSLVAAVLARGGLDPTVIVGGKLRAISTNARLGSGRYIVAEADESDGQFIRLPSSIAVITNIDLEHLDHYPGLEAIKDAFVRYAGKVPFYGAVIMCNDDENVRDIATRIIRRKVTYSLGGEADVTGEILERSEEGTRFSVSSSGSPLGEIEITMPGEHYARNALAAVATGLEMELSFSAIKEGLESFQGVGRRFELKGETPAGVLVVDDYGHHPTEITATVRAALDNYRRRLFVLFQPHRYSRTQALAAEFAHCFDGAHKVYITDIYPAGEKPIPGVTADTIIDRVREAGAVEIAHAPSLEGMVEAVAAEVKPGDIVITMGAGDIWRAGEALLEKLGRND